VAVETGEAARDAGIGSLAADACGPGAIGDRVKRAVDLLGKEEVVESSSRKTVIGNECQIIPTPFHITPNNY